VTAVPSQTSKHARPLLRGLIRNPFLFGVTTLFVVGLFVAFSRTIYAGRFFDVILHKQGFVLITGAMFHQAVTFPRLVFLSHIGLIFAGVLVVYIWVSFLWRYFWDHSRRNKMYGQEKGSARLASWWAMRNFADRDDPSDNWQLGKWTRLGLAATTISHKYFRFPFVFVTAEPGGGKSTYIMTQILRTVKNKALKLLVIGDTKGDILRRVGWLFKFLGFDIKVFNTYNPLESNCWDMWACLDDKAGLSPGHKSTLDPQVEIMRIADMIVNGTKDVDKNITGDMQFFQDQKRIIIQCLGGYMHYFCPGSRSMKTFLELVDMLLPDPGQDISLFERLINQVKTGKRYVGIGVPDADAAGFITYEVAQPQHWVVRQWQHFKDNIGSPETVASIVGSVHASFSRFTADRIQTLLSHDEFHFDKLLDPGKKTVIFVVSDARNSTFHFLNGMFLNQLMSRIVYLVDNFHGGQAAGLIEVMIDEFLAFGRVPDLDNNIGVSRSYGFYWLITTLSFVKIEELYGREAAQTIRELCGVWVTLGTGSYEVNKAFSERAGELTVAHDAVTSRGGEKQSTDVARDQIDSRALLDPSEVGRIPRSHLLIQVSSFNSRIDKRYINEHNSLYRYVDPGHRRPLWPKIQYGGPTLLLPWLLPSVHFKIGQRTYAIRHGRRFGIKNGDYIGLRIGQKAEYLDTYVPEFPDHSAEERQHSTRARPIGARSTVYVSGKDGSDVSYIHTEYRQKRPQS